MIDVRPERFGSSSAAGGGGHMVDKMRLHKCKRRNIRQCELW